MSEYTPAGLLLIMAFSAGCSSSDPAPTLINDQPANIEQEDPQTDMISMDRVIRLETPQENCERLSAEITSQFGVPLSFDIDERQEVYEYEHGTYMTRWWNDECISSVPWDRNPIEVFDDDGSPVAAPTPPVFTGYANQCSMEKERIVSELGSDFIHEFEGGNSALGFETWTYANGEVVGFHADVNGFTNSRSCIVYRDAAGLRYETAPEACMRIANEVVAIAGEPDSAYQTSNGIIIFEYSDIMNVTFKSTDDALFCDTNVETLPLGIRQTHIIVEASEAPDSPVTPNPPELEPIAEAPIDQPVEAGPIPEMPEPEVVIVEEPIVLGECLTESGTDGYSANNAWNDNCTVRRFGDFADSLYMLGVQRVLFCTGFATSATGRIEDYTDGEMGPLSERFVQDYQRDRGLVDDGIVDAATWASLQSEISFLSAGNISAEGGRDSYGFTEGVCANRILFYQWTSISDSGLSIDRGGWNLAKNPPSESESKPFSIELPYQPPIEDD